MSRVCTICSHPQRAEIDRALIAGEPCSTIAARYITIGRMALQRHKADHISPTLARAQEVAEVARADSLLDQLRGLQERTLEILSRAEASGKLETALKAIREVRGNLELLAELLGRLDRQPQVNLLVAPEWIALRSKILRALAPYPEIRCRLVEALDDSS